MAFDKETFDLFDFLGKLNRRDANAYDNLSEDGKKAAHPFVIMRWLTGTSDQAQIVRLNTFANKYIFNLGHNKPLLFKLLAASCTGAKRNKWIKGPGGSSKKLSLEAIKTKYRVSNREAEEYLQFIEPQEIQAIGDQAGWDKDTMKKLQIELGIEVSKPKKK